LGAVGRCDQPLCVVCTTHRRLNTSQVPASYDSDSRHFVWTNGTPQVQDISTSELFLQGLGSIFALDVRVDPAPAVLTLHLTTYFSGGKVVATLDGANGSPLSGVVEPLEDSAKPRVRIRFSGPAGATMHVRWELTTERDSGGDKPNIALL